MDDLVKRLRELWPKYWEEALAMDEVEATLEEAAARITALEASERSAFQHGAEKMREMAAKVCDEVANPARGFECVNLSPSGLCNRSGHRDCLCQERQETAEANAIAIRAIPTPAP